MMTKANAHGFTTIEIVVLLIVICILSGLILATHHGIDQKMDNNERQRDINSLRIALETYYSRYSKYPTFGQLNNAKWRAKNMTDLDQESLRDPENKTYQLAMQPAPKAYAYVPESANGHTCDNAKVICAQYTLTATLAGGGTYVKYNLD